MEFQTHLLLSLAMMLTDDGSRRNSIGTSTILSPSGCSYSLHLYWRSFDDKTRTNVSSQSTRWSRQSCNESVRWEEIQFQWLRSASPKHANIAVYLACLEAKKRANICSKLFQVNDKASESLYCCTSRHRTVRSFIMRNRLTFFND